MVKEKKEKRIQPEIVDFCFSVALKLRSHHTRITFLQGLLKKICDSHLFECHFGSNAYYTLQTIQTILGVSGGWISWLGLQ